MTKRTFAQSLKSEESVKRNYEEIAMQTFLISGNFYEIAKTLDPRRANKQIIECYQIMRIMLRKVGFIDDGKKGWMNHPVLKLWQDKDGKFYFFQLYYYTCFMLKTYKERYDKEHSMVQKIEELYQIALECHDFGNSIFQVRWPKEVYKAMRQNLIRKDKEYYRKKFPNEKGECQGYVWDNLVPIRLF